MYVKFKNVIVSFALIHWLNMNCAFAHSSEEFLNSVINQLRYARTPQIEYRALYDNYPYTMQDADQFNWNNVQETDDPVNHVGYNVTEYNQDLGSQAGNQNLIYQNVQQSNIAAENAVQNLDAQNGEQNVALQINNNNQNLANTQVLQNTEGTSSIHSSSSENLNPVQVPPAAYYYHHPDNHQNIANIVDMIADNHIPNQYMNMMDQDVTMNKKPVEPLFVAMAGFVGIAMIFMSAMMFLPKLLTPSPDVSNLKKGPQEIAALTKLAVEAIEGNDCTERIACEVGRAMRTMQVDSKQIRIMEIVLPTNMSKQLAQIRKALITKQKCRFIPCKRMLLQNKNSKKAKNISNAAQL